MPGEASVTAKADGLDFPVLLCGHTHVSRIVRLRDGRLVVNPGSVGLQFNYGAPDARYAVLERHGGQWSASIRAVPYDFEAAAQQVIANGFPHWARSDPHRLGERDRVVLRVRLSSPLPWGRGRPIGPGEGAFLRSVLAARPPHPNPLPPKGEGAPEPNPLGQPALSAFAGTTIEDGDNSADN